MKNFFTAVFCCLQLWAFSQTAIVRGSVKDEKTQQPIANAVVSLNGTNLSATSGADGKFAISNVPYGRYRIVVKANGHVTYKELYDIKQAEVIVGDVGVENSDEMVEILKDQMDELQAELNKTKEELKAAKEGHNVAAPVKPAEPEVKKPEPKVENPIQVKIDNVNLGDDSLNTSEDDVRSTIENVPTVTLSDNDLAEVGQSVSSNAGANRDVFVSAANFVMASAHFRIRGYKPDEFTVLMNGVPVNDLENGSVTPNSWGGLNTVVRHREYSVGLAASEDAFGGVGGSLSFDTRASVQRKMLEVSYSEGNRNFRHRLMATYNTGLLKHGWAVSAVFSKRWAEEGYVPGTFYDGYSYFLSVDKHFGSNNTLSFTTFGTPTREGRQVITTQEAYDLAGSNYYNPAWGYQNGKKRNAYVTDRFQPQFILNDQWKINSKSNLELAAGFSFGKNSTSDLDWNNAPDPRPDYYQYMPSYLQDSSMRALAQQQFKQDVNTRQINWQNLYDVNRNSFDTISNANGIAGNNMRINRSRVIQEKKVQNRKRFNFNATYNAALAKHVDFTAGLYYQYEITERYKQVVDLLGGKYYVDIDQYADLTYPDSADAAQNDLNHPNRLLTVGDKFGYDYNMVVHHGGVWAQPHFKFNRIDFFVAGQFSTTAFWRNGLYRNGSFPNNSFGKSATNMFYNYSVKGGLTYNPGKGHYLYANGANLTVAPFVDDVFVSAKTRNEIVDNVKNQKIYSFEAGYIYKSSIISARGTFFYTQFNDQTQTRSYYDDLQHTFVNYTLTGINTRHYGAEASIEAKLYRGFSASAVASIGRYNYTSRPTGTVTQDNSAAVLEKDIPIYLKNFNVAGSPQLATSFGLSYRSPQFWFITLHFNYYDWMWVEASPIRATEQAVAPLTAGSQAWNDVIDQQRLKGQFTMDLFAGYSWMLNKQFKNLKKRYFLVFGLNIANITNNTHFITNGYEQLRFDFLGNNASKFPSKYQYAYGTNYMLTVAFRMN